MGGTPPPTPPTGGISGFFRRIWNTLIFYRIGILTNLKEIFTFHRKFDLKKIPRRPGEVAVITGGARGIGIEVVKKLLILDMHVVIGCRNRTSGLEAVENLRKSGITTGTTNILTLDLTSLASVRDFGDKVMIKYPKIHILINNGGIMAVPYALTVEGNESQFQVNYLSHFLLTNILLPKLIRSGRVGKAARIVNVSSVAHYGGKIDFEDINMTQMYCKNMGYMSSKLMQVVSTKHLNGKLEKEGIHVKVYAVHPGVVQTDLYQNVFFVRTFKFLFKLIYKSPEQGADCVLYAAISSKFEGEGGLFFANSKSASVNSLAKKLSVQEKLWDMSSRMTGWDDPPLAEIVKNAMIAVRKGPSVVERPPQKSISGGSVDHHKKENTNKKLERQPNVQETAPIVKPEIQTPRISIASASSHDSSVSSNISTNTVVGNDQVAVVIIPPTATHTEASSSEEDEVSLGWEHSSDKSSNSNTMVDVTTTYAEEQESNSNGDDTTIMVTSSGGVTITEITEFGQPEVAEVEINKD